MGPFNNPLYTPLSNNMSKPLLPQLPPSPLPQPPLSDTPELPDTDSLTEPSSELPQSLPDTDLLMEPSPVPDSGLLTNKSTIQATKHHSFKKPDQTKPNQILKTLKTKSNFCRIKPVTLKSWHHKNKKS